MKLYSILLLNVMLFAALAAWGQQSDPPAQMQPQPGPSMPGPGGWGPHFQPRVAPPRGPWQGPGDGGWGQGFARHGGYEPRFGGPEHGFGMMGRGSFDGPMMGRLAQELNLTPDQKNRFEQLRFQAEKAAIQSRAATETARLELRQLLRAENPDRAAIERKITEIGNLHTQEMKAKMGMMLDMRGVLTAEQRAKLKQLREQHGMMPPGPMAPRRGAAPRRAPAPAQPQPKQ